MVALSGRLDGGADIRARLTKSPADLLPIC
jgi:hypothetical protein